MTGKISLILGSHAHLSPSAGEEEFEELYRNKLKPFITALNQFPKVQAILHYSGPLFSRLEQKKPELFFLIKDLVARKQIEVLGGGFYEPLMSLLPLTDKIGQIEMLTTYVRQNFGRKPQGCWLAHSIWEQSLVGVLNTCGMAYTFLSEKQFTAGGCIGESLYTPVFTEDQGKLVAVFPVFSSLAGMGKNGAFPVLQTKLYPQAGLVTVFPEFPADHAEEGTISFFADLAGALAEKSRGGFAVELTTPGKVFRSCLSLPRLYFHASSDLPGIQPRALLTKYPEANDLYSKIFFIHNLINQLRGDKSRKRSAREELWKAQGLDTFCSIRESSSFWERKYAYRSILGAERIVRERDFKPSLLAFDFNLNKSAEYLFQDKNINCYVQTRGASVFELDYLPKGWNYLDTFAEGAYRRCAFMDRLLPGDFVPLGISSFPEGSRFCGEEEYDVSSSDRQKLKASFILPPQKGVPFGSIEIQKTYKLEKNLLRLSYILRNRGEEPRVLCFVPQFDFSFTGQHLLFRKSQGEEELSTERSGEKKRILALEEQDAKHGASLSLSFQRPCDLYYYPVESEQVYQSSCFLPVFQLFLNPGDEWNNELTLTVSSKARGKSQEKAAPSGPMEGNSYR
jgi:hypothetical protein